jgi:ABC-type glycerol-3-phosphate transport system permease component
LRWLRRVDVQCGSYWFWIAFREFDRLCTAVEKLSQFFKVLTKRFEHAALVQGCGGMQ